MVLEGERRRGPRLLIIDDDDLFRMTLRAIFEDAGFEVVEAPDGNHGIEAFERRPADVVITDILMPEKEGIETILELRRSHPEVKIIAMSGGGEAGNANFLDMAEKLGANRILNKPFTRSDVLNAVEGLLTRFF